MNLLRRGVVLHSVSILGAFALSENAIAAEKLSKPKDTLRLVSIGGALTEIIYLLNKERYLLGVDTTSIYPEAATKLPNVGYARTLSAEGILALRPNQVIATDDAGPPIVLKQIADAGIPISVLSSNYQFKGVIDRIQKVGKLTQATVAAQQWLDQLHVDWEKTQQQVSNSDVQKIKVLFVLAQNPTQLMVSGRKTSADAMITYAGAHNAVTEFAGYKPLTPEALIHANPNVILTTDQTIRATGGIDGLMRFPGMGRILAGKQESIVSLDTMYLLGFGPRMPMAVADLNKKFQVVLSS